MGTKQAKLNAKAINTATKMAIKTQEIALAPAPAEPIQASGVAGFISSKPEPASQLLSPTHGKNLIARKLQDASSESKPQ